MGCGPSKHSLGMLAGIVYPQTVDFLCLKTKDIEKLIEFYKYVDVDGSASLSAEELLRACDVDVTPFNKKACQMTDMDHSGDYDFREFLFAIWNICTLDKKGLAYYAFDIYDEDRSGTLDKGEVVTMIQDAYGKKVGSAFARQGMNQIHELNDDQVTRTEFVKLASRDSALLFPAYDMQRKIKQRMMGQGFWEEACKKRLSSKNRLAKPPSWYALYKKCVHLDYERWKRCENRLGMDGPTYKHAQEELRLRIKPQRRRQLITNSKVTSGQRLNKNKKAVAPKDSYNNRESVTVSRTD